MHFSKIIKGSLAAILFSAAIIMGCQNESEPENINLQISFRADDFSYIGDEVEDITRTSVSQNGQFTWAANDTVGIYPDAGAQIYFEMTAGAGASSANFDGGGWAMKPNSIYYSYSPFIGDMYLDRHNIPVAFEGQKQIGTVSTEHIGKYDYMYTPGTSAADGELSFSYHHLCCIIRPNVTLPAGTYTKLAVTAPTAVFAKRGHYDLQSENPEIIKDEYTDQLVIDLEDVTLATDGSFMVYLLSAPVNLQGVEITVSVLNSEKKEYQCKKIPSREYTAGSIGGLTCSTFNEVPQSMGLILDGWGDGGSIGGNAD